MAKSAYAQDFQFWASHVCGRHLRCGDVWETHLRFDQMWAANIWWHASGLGISAAAVRRGREFVRYLIDVQLPFGDSSGLANNPVPPHVAGADALLDGAANCGLPVIHVLHDVGDARLPVTWLGQQVSEESLQPQANAFVLEELVGDLSESPARFIALVDEYRVHGGHPVLGSPKAEGNWHLIDGDTQNTGYLLYT